MIVIGTFPCSQRELFEDSAILGLVKTRKRGVRYSPPILLVATKNQLSLVYLCADSSAMLSYMAAHMCPAGGYSQYGYE